MELIYYTVAAVVLYLVSDWILNQIEIRRGERFENRSLVFFAIILVLAVATFNLVQKLLPVPDSDVPAPVQPQQGGDQTRP
jgi:hypothetical protein